MKLSTSSAWKFYKNGQWVHIALHILIKHNQVSKFTTEYKKYHLLEAKLSDCHIVNISFCVLWICVILPRIFPSICKNFLSRVPTGRAVQWADTSMHRSFYLLLPKNLPSFTNNLPSHTEECSSHKQKPQVGIEKTKKTSRIIFQSIVT